MTQAMPIGHRIRDQRSRLGMTQRALAKTVGISAAYMNLIEHDRRQIGGKLLRRIAGALRVEVGALSLTEEAALVPDLVDLAQRHSLVDLQEDRVLGLVAGYPEWARLLLRLNEGLRDARETSLALSDRLAHDPRLRELSHRILTLITSVRSSAEILQDYPSLEEPERDRFAGIIAKASDRLSQEARSMIDLLGGDERDALQPSTPVRELDDFIRGHGNYFGDLEFAAEDLRQGLLESGEEIAAAIARRLTERHGVTISKSGVAADEEAAPVPPLVLPDDLSEATCRFRMARRLAALEFPALLHRMLRDGRLNSQEARQRARAALIRYAAGALLFPYEPFYAAAEETRYDIERLQRRFAASFEQVAHRLVTLRRPRREGVPFAFLRVDPAGNVSKRFSLPGLRMPSYSGACPLWAAYAAFGRPGQTVAQLAAMPDDNRFLFVARRVTKETGGFGQPDAQHAVMLACEAGYAERLVYGDAFAGGAPSLVTPVGFECRSCRRADCRQRAADPLPGLSG